MGEWPNPSDYNIAIQNPNISFKDLDLKNSSCEENYLTRMPKVWTGNFAQVYKLSDGKKTWAVKCFTRSPSDITKRYELISNAIVSSNLTYFIDFSFIEKGIFLKNKYFPIVKMEWAEGETLDQYVQRNLNSPTKLLELAVKIKKMVADIESKNIAHGDLQHGNIIINNNKIILVDYDGLFISSFAGTFATEKGLPAYQHPKRNGKYFDHTLDRFSLLVICTALCALAANPLLWYEYNTGDNLLFTKSDFENPDNSRLLKQLISAHNEQVKSFALLLRSAALTVPEKISFPLVDINFTSIERPWWVDQSRIQTNIKTALPVSNNSVNTFVRKSISQEFIFSVLGLCLLISAALLNYIQITLVMIGSLIIIIYYFIKKRNIYYEQPSIKRKNDLKELLNKLDNEIANIVVQKNKIEGEPVKLTQMEQAELNNALKEGKERALLVSLAKVSINELTSIKGFGPFVLGNLKSSGIYNAADLYKQKWSHIRGIGDVKSYQIDFWLKQLIKNIILPVKVPSDLENKITSKYKQQRNQLLIQIQSLSNKLQGLQTEVAQKRNEYNNIRIPAFFTFIKNHL